MKGKIQLFQDQSIRTHWDEDKELWYFSVIDVIAVLAENTRPRKYWSDLKKKLNDEGSELSEKIGQLKMKARDSELDNNWGTNYTLVKILPFYRAMATYLKKDKLNLI